MNELDECEQNLAQMRYEVSVFRADLKFRKFLRAVKAGFNADQPRDDDGRWTATGTDQIDIAARGNEAECDLQYKKDTVICRLVRTPLCWAQATERYGACLAGRRVPQLRF
jgi:hypothetical protein